MHCEESSEYPVWEHAGTTNNGIMRAAQDPSLPRFIDHDGGTFRDTSSDGMSYAGTVVRGGVGQSTASSSNFAMGCQ